MKNGKKPTLAQKKFLQDTGLDSEKWLIVKDTPEEMVIVSRIALQRRSGKTKTMQETVYHDVHGQLHRGKPGRDNQGNHN